ncbi:7-cyano-7-deazaguanine synthase [Patescibacteria group bacterium]|nr:7-cyano-7-deazaguanine synthase [Patescibacteria group bacterium]MBU1499845.1 7-cyano-7-deazaguanine synthase [Patescibacteria group bacterium]
MIIKTKYNEDLLKGLQRKKTKKIVLLYSGGIDSTAAGMVLKTKGYKVFPLFIDYGQTALEAEKYLVQKTAKILGFEPVKIIKTDLLKQLTKSSLLGGQTGDDNQAWVPGRNTLFMIIAGILAKQIDADGICLGYMLDDNFVFGDNDYFHHKSIEELLSKSFLQPMAVMMPTVDWQKKDLIALLKKGKVLQHTVSCWNAKLKDSQIILCHKCANCIERENLLAKL